LPKLCLACILPTARCCVLSAVTFHPRYRYESPEFRQPVWLRSRST
jgi:hypothetical protein